MSMATSIANEVERHEKQMQRLVSAFKAKIQELPDNPRISRVSQNGFVAMSSSMGDNWSVEHHDFKSQYRHLTDLITASPGRAVQIVKDAIERKSIRVGPRECRFTIGLHPDVVEHLQVVMGN
jgi:hypothetical protein